MSNLLPPNATALERDVAAVLGQIDGVPVPLRDLVNPATCPEVALLPLAWQESVDTWDDSWSIEQRRAVIDAAPGIHRRKGTAGSVRAAVATLGMGATIYEWWQETPKAAPYTFRVEIDDIGVTPELVNSVERQIRAVKPARSFFTMQLIARPMGSLYIGAGIQDCTETTIYPKTA